MSDTPKCKNRARGNIFKGFESTKLKFRVEQKEIKQGDTWNDLEWQDDERNKVWAWNRK